MTTISNAGPPPPDVSCDDPNCTGCPPPQPPADAPQWCVRVDAEDVLDPERRMLSWATLAYGDITAPELAVYEAAVTRRNRPWEKGTLRVRIWPTGPQDFYQAPPPLDAEVFVFGEGLPLPLVPCARHDADQVCPGCVTHT